jgi:choline dehydrogenase-like flavoprotein
LNIKLETDRGVHIHAAEIPREGEPPDVLFWDGRVFRYVRTDGVWDQKKHVYREATSSSLNASQNAEQAIAALEAAQERTALAAHSAEEQDGRKVSLNLTKPQAALLGALRERHGHASNKATIIAALEAFDKASALNNDALLALLAKRLRGIGPAPRPAVDQPRTD